MSGGPNAPRWRLAATNDGAIDVGGAIDSRFYVGAYAAGVLHLEHAGRYLLLLGALPSWPYSGGWGYYPSGGLGTILLIVMQNQRVGNEPGGLTFLCGLFFARIACL